MITKTTFVNRNANKKHPRQSIDAIKIIENALAAHPNNRIDPNSPIYKIAVRQYNDAIKNSTTRPPVPAWFCGIVNPKTNELQLGLTDEALRASSGFVINPTLSATPLSLETNKYTIDVCLQSGTPGSYGYSKCTDYELAQVEAGQLASIDWLSGMFSNTNYEGASGSNLGGE